jgi:hypothetical protein
MDKTSDGLEGVIYTPKEGYNKYHGRNFNKGG